MLSIIGMFCLLLLSGCERGVVTDENFPVVGSDELIPISVQVDGIDNFYGGAVTRGGVTEESFRQALDTLKDSGYDVVTTYETVQPEPSVKTRATLANVRFRLVAYKSSISTSNYAGQCDYLTNGSGVASAQSAPMKLPQGNYVFVCYSYGTNADLPAFNGSSATTVSVANGQDFMTWTSAITNVTLNEGGQYTLSGITFNRLCSQLEISVQSAGFPGSNKITSCAGTVSGLSNTPANWSIGASAISTTGTSGSATITWSNTNSSSVLSNKVIILPSTNRKVTVKLSTLRISDGHNLDNKVSVTTSEREFTKGGYYRISITVEPNYISVCNYKWAKANLASDGVIEASQNSSGGYFGWNTRSTNKGQYNGGNYTTGSDPCYTVAPQGTWYTPSESQLANLKNCAANSYVGHGFYFADNKIFIASAGARTSSGSINFFGEFGYLWSRDSQTSSSGRAMCLYKTASIGNYVRTDGRSVRCVKGM